MVIIVLIVVMVIVFVFVMVMVIVVMVIVFVFVVVIVVMVIVIVFSHCDATSTGAARLICCLAEVFEFVPLLYAPTSLASVPVAIKFCLFAVVPLRFTVRDVVATAWRHW